jgi:hypothetical protein
LSRCAIDRPKILLAAACIGGVDGDGRRSKGIRDLHDIVRAKPRFINQQCGSQARRRSFRRPPPKPISATLLATDGETGESRGTKPRNTAACPITS